jgi:hypothetical protein
MRSIEQKFCRNLALMLMLRLNSTADMYRFLLLCQCFQQQEIVLRRLEFSDTYEENDGNQ